MTGQLDAGLAMRPFSASLPMALLQAREAAMRLFRPLLAEHDLTEQQWRVIRALAATEEPLDAGELAHRTFLLAPSLTRILQYLEGLEREEVDERIRRACRVVSPRRETEAQTAGSNALLARRNNLLGSAYRLFYERPLHIVRGRGVWLYDGDGRAYLDAYNNVALLGHCHPAVVAALTKQAATLNTHTRYLHATILDYAARLLGLFPEYLDRVMFCCTGSEANELALRLARAYTGNRGVIVSDDGRGLDPEVVQVRETLVRGLRLRAHTWNRKKITSPSCTSYGLPSSRRRPSSRA